MHPLPWSTGLVVRRSRLHGQSEQPSTCLRRVPSATPSGHCKCLRMRVDGYDLIAHCLKAEGVEWMPCFPANPLIEAVATVGIRPLVFRQGRGGVNAADGYSRQTRARPVGVFASQSGRAAWPRRGPAGGHGGVRAAEAGGEGAQRRGGLIAAVPAAASSTVAEGGQQPPSSGSCRTCTTRRLRRHAMDAGTAWESHRRVASRRVAGRQC